MRLRAIARGLVAGAAGGLLWAGLEAALGWASGSVVPAAVALRILGLDVAVAAAIAVGVALVGPRAGLRVTALALVGAYGLLRVYAPPGLGAEASYAAMVAVASVLVVRVAGGDASALAFLQMVALGAVGVLGGDFWLDEQHGAALRGMWLPVTVAGLAMGPLALDGLAALALRRTGLRVGLEAVAGAIALLVTAAPLSTAPLVDDVVTAVPPPAGTPDVILVSMDTTRADHLSTYGYGRETSPNLTAFAADALLFTQARSPAGWTLPGHASMLTGLYPARHGAMLAGTWLGGQSIDGRRNVAHPLAPGRVTLAQALRDRGYRTAGFVANFSYLYRDYGIGRGFGFYDDAPGLLLRVHPPVIRLARLAAPAFCVKPYRTAREMNAAALGWLDRAPAGRPIFLFLNYMEPHQPYMADPPYDRWVQAQPRAAELLQRDLYTHEIKTWKPDELAFVTATYDGQVAAMDAGLGELLAALKARGRYENALVVVTADHGELLGEHGSVGHMGRMLYEPLVHVPMVVKFPGAEHARGRDDTPVQLVDVVPTALRAAGAPPIPDVQGEPLPAVHHAILAEEGINPYLASSYGAAYDRAVRVLYDGSYKLITTSRGDRMLFDLARDPGEDDNLVTREPERAEALARRLETAFGPTVVAADVPRSR
jgi:arylsulfatase A-like enzyme